MNVKEEEEMTREAVRLLFSRLEGEGFEAITVTFAILLSGVQFQIKKLDKDLQIDYCKYLQADIDRLKVKLLLQ